MAGIISSTANLYFTYKFLRTLTYKWTEMDAYKLGIIDENGKVLKKARTLNTPEERDAYSIFHRLAFNLKRILEKLPFGKSKLASYAAALYLIKEYKQFTNEEIQYIIDNIESDMENTVPLCEWFIDDDMRLSPGSYTLNHDVLCPQTFEVLAPRGSQIIAEDFCEPVGMIHNQAIYSLWYPSASSNIFVSQGSIEK